ncbi:hypothetical protein PFTANZ_01658, partial [Plasmodium falciparum Tanzania (2000708)]
EPPDGYGDACGCDSRTEPVVPKKEEKKDACTIVETLLNQSNGGKNGINSCYRKNYNGWNCNSDQFEKSHAGACMPPRRKSLCIYILTLQEQIKDEDKLREAFIKCAAAETCLLWHNYKKDKNDNANNLDNTLKGGNIPEDFKRQMFYTFGDYRDICLGTDISSDSNIKGISRKVKDILNSQNGKTHEQKITPESWWKSIEKEVWKGMLCALSYDTEKKKMDPIVRKKLTDNNKYSKVSSTLEDFASRPPFLRWFTEWGDQFCREREKQLESLKKKCPEKICKGTDENKQKCTEACSAYKTFIKNWKENYEKQSEKYFQDKKDNKFESTSANAETISSNHAYEYLNKSLKKLCPDGSCS